MIEDDLPRPKPALVIGADLSRHSVEDLREYVAALEAEIARVRAELERKTSAIGGAEALFRSRRG